MKNKTSQLISLFILLTILTACGGLAEEDIILTVGSVEYTQYELEGFDSITTDYTNKDGETTTYSGVALTVLLEDAGLTSGDKILFTAVDGYEAELSMDDALGCNECLLAIENDSLRMVMPDMSSKLQVKDVVTISIP